MTLTVLSQVLADLDSGQALVVAPIRVAKQTWPTELAEWSQASWIKPTLIRAEDTDDDIREVFDARRSGFIRAAQMLDVPVALRNRLATAFANPFRDQAKRDKRARLARTLTPLHVIGIEQLEWLVGFHGKHWPYRTVVVDESSKFKDFSTRRWKALNSVYKKIDRMHLLTASPAPETMLDLFGQVYLLDRGERLGRRITHFRDAHFNHNEYTRSYEIKSGHAEKISEKIADICLVMRAEDHLDLAKPIYLNRYITLADETVDMYDRFLETFVLSLPTAEIEALNGGALINKLLQFTGGAVYDEDKRMHEVHDDKLDDLAQLIDEIDTPVMVAYWYQSSLKRLRKRFPHAIVMDKAGKAVDPWNAGKIDMLLIHPASAGHGLNMQKGPGRDLVYFDLVWSRELYEQLIGRLARQGQRHVVRVWHQIVKRADDGVRRSRRQMEDLMTADEIVMQALADKGEGQNTFLRYVQAIRERVRARQFVLTPVDSDSEDL